MESGGKKEGCCSFFFVFFPFFFFLFFSFLLHPRFPAFWRLLSPRPLLPLFSFLQNERTKRRYTED